MFMRLKKLRSRRFYITLIFSYIVILFLSLMCAALGYRHLYKNVREQTLEQISLQLKQATYITEGYIESVKNSLLALTMSPQAQAFAYIDKLSNADDFYQLMQMTQMITGISAGNTSLSCLLMYAEGIDSVIYSTSRMDRTEYFQTNLRFAGMNEDTWKEEISQTGYLKTLPVHMNEQTGQKLIGFISSIPLVSPHGTVIAYLDEALLGKAFAAGGLTQEGSILILSNNEPICTIGAENWFRREDGSYAYDEDGGEHALSFRAGQRLDVRICDSERDGDFKNAAHAYFYHANVNIRVLQCRAFLDRSGSCQLFTVKAVVE